MYVTSNLVLGQFDPRQAFQPVEQFGIDRQFAVPDRLQYAVQPRADGLVGFSGQRLVESFAERRIGRFLGRRSERVAKVAAMQIGYLPLQVLVGHGVRRRLGRLRNLFSRRIGILPAEPLFEQFP